MLRTLTQHVISLSLLLLLVVLQRQIWGPGSTSIELNMLAIETQELHHRLDTHAQRNAKLSKEIKTFHNDPNAMEAKARRNLGMIRNGETFFFMPDGEAAPLHKQAAP